MPEYRRRPEDGTGWKIAKDFWPIILAVVSVVSMYTHLDGRVNNVEKLSDIRGPITYENSTRITRLETIVINLADQQKDLKTSLDRIYQKVK